MAYGWNDKTTITYNDCLKDVEFYRVFDPYSAYQEIEMFLNNLAIPQKDMPKIPDRENILSHGFDDKLSFRKEKSK
jgi:hypothetical protein